MARLVRPPYSVLLLLAGLGGCGPSPAQAPRSAPAHGVRRVPLGLCEDYPEESRSLAEVRRDLEVLEAAGIAVLRVSIGWDGVEPERDRYDFAFWDEFVELAVEEFGVTLLPYVAYTPRWNSDGADEEFWRTPPRDRREFAEILGLLAQRYRGRIRSWELWNEPDNRDYWLGTSAEYAALLEAGAEAVRGADPRAQVVFGGLAGGVEFLREVFDEHGGSEHVDVVNLHAYYETWNPNPVETIPEYVGEVEAIVRRHGRWQPIWMAEVGYSNYRSAGQRGSTFTYEHSLDFQAVMLLRTMALLLAEPAVSLVAWYELKDARPADAVIGDAHNRHLGVLFADYAPKPAFAALSFANRLFSAGFRSVARELRVVRPPASQLELRGFLTARRTLVLIAWLRTRPAPGSGVPGGARRRPSERIRVVAPYAARGEAKLYDERGRPRPFRVSTRVDSANTELELELGSGEVSVVELPVAAP